jgi:hypothetical protein
MQRGQRTRGLRSGGVFGWVFGLRIYESARKVRLRLCPGLHRGFAPAIDLAERAF